MKYQTKKSAIINIIRSHSKKNIAENKQSIQLYARVNKSRTAHKSIEPTLTIFTHASHNNQTITQLTKMIKALPLSIVLTIGVIISDVNAELYPGYERDKREIYRRGQIIKQNRARQEAGFNIWYESLQSKDKVWYHKIEAEVARDQIIHGGEGNPPGILERVTKRLGASLEQMSIVTDARQAGMTMGGLPLSPHRLNISNKTRQILQQVSNENNGLYFTYFTVMYVANIVGVDKGEEFIVAKDFLDNIASSQGLFKDTPFAVTGLKIDNNPNRFTKEDKERLRSLSQKERNKVQALLDPLYNGKNDYSQITVPTDMNIMIVIAATGASGNIAKGIDAMMKGMYDYMQNQSAQRKPNTTLHQDAGISNREPVFD